jgi:hypothetical protein
MPLEVVCFCGYYMNKAVPSRQEDWYSYKWIQALKGHSVNGYAKVPVRGVSKRLTHENRSSAVEWFGIFVGDYFESGDIGGPFVVVPVPNSDCTGDSGVKPRTRKLAKAICDVFDDGSFMVDCLRWKKNLGSAREGGPREPDILFKNLALQKDDLRGALEDLEDGTAVILVDDVTTSGGHLQASAAKLNTFGMKVDHVVCAGKTVYDQTNPAFYNYEYSLEEFES